MVKDGRLEDRICSHPEYLYNRHDILKENFLAPEQYQYNATILSDLENISEDDLPAFNEKIDIYKIPAITGQYMDLWDEMSNTPPLVTPV